MNKQHSQPHKRKEIRKKITELLKGWVDIGGKVYSSRPNAAWLNEVPLALVYYNSEGADSQNTAPKKYKKSLMISIQVLARFEKEIEDYLDSRAYEIEAALGDDKFLGIDYVEDVDLIKTTPVSIDDTGNENIEAVILNFEVTYRHRAEVIGSLDEFLSFNSDIDTPDGQKTEDIVEIRSK